MHIYKRVNDIEFRYENIKINEEITYEFIKKIIETIREPNLDIINEEIGFTTEDKYPLLCYKMIKFTHDSFHKVFDHIEEYGEIENQWFKDNNDQFRLLYPNLLK
jgi:hypothetical protein